MSNHDVVQPRFYTLPPSGVDWPYLLVNPNNYKVLFKRKFKHAILDCGVERFNKNPELKDYPKSFLENWKWKAKELTEIFGERLFVTIPDYTDDFNPGQFGDNVSKTLANIKEFVSVEGVNWLPVIQSRYLDRFSFMESCQMVREAVGDYPRVAVGTVCKTQKLSFIEYCCKAARKHFPKSWIHAFGLTLNSLPRVKGYINSWDSLAWTFPRKPGASCKNAKERVQFFTDYLKRLNMVA
jgi:hypothetical protein